MKHCRLYLNFTLWFGIQFLLSLNTQSQLINFHTGFDSIDSSSNYSFLGKTNDRIWILKTSSKEFPSIYFLDSNGSVHNRISLKANGLNRAFRPQAMFAGDTVSLFYQYRKGNYVYQNLLLLDLTGKMLGEIKQLDSARADILREGALMQFLPIPAARKILLYRLITGLNPGKLITDHATFTSTGTLIDKTNHTIPFDRNVQEISAIHLHTNGNAYFIIYDKPDAYRLFSKLTLYQLNSTSSNSKIRDIPYKGIKPVRPIFVKTITPSNKLGLSSIYFEKESSIPNGVFVTETDISNSSQPVTTTYFPLQQIQNKYSKAGSFKLPVAYRPARKDRLVLYAAFQKSNGGWDFLIENGYTITNTSSSFSSQNAANPSSTVINNYTPSQEMDQLRNQAIQNINYSSNNSTGTFQFGNQGNNNITQLGGISNNFIRNNGYLDELERMHTQLPIGTQDQFYTNEFKESQKLIHYFISVNAPEGVKDHLKFQSTIISKQLPLQSIKLINDSSVLIADVGNNSDRFDLKSMQTNDANWRKEIKLKKGKTILWRESILHFHQRLYILYIDETYRTIGLATIKE